MSGREGRIVVVDYHEGNLRSVERALAEVGASVVVSDEARDVDGAAGVVLPGVGAFEDAMGQLLASGQAQSIVAAIGRGVPFLGICLGMQLLFSRGSERRDGPSSWGGEWVPGLGVLEGSVIRLESKRLKVPHVGWDQAHLSELGRTCPLLADVPEGANFYFTHSYALADDVDEGIVVTRTHYARSFASGVWSDNVFGLQFHPEKSSRAGRALLANFVSVVRG